MVRLGGVIAVCACATAVLAGCSGQPAAPPVGSSTSSAPTLPAASDLTPAPTDAPALNDDGSTGEPRPGSTLVLDAAARVSATAAATKVMRLFARRDVSADQWWNDLVPLLSATAAQAYRSTDPRNVPPTAVTGTGKITPSSTPLVARVAVPTNAGVYLVILSRSDASPTWLAERITPPEGQGDS